MSGPLKFAASIINVHVNLPPSVPQSCSSTRGIPPKIGSATQEVPIKIPPSSSWVSWSSSKEIRFGGTITLLERVTRPSSEQSIHVSQKPHPPPVSLWPEYRCVAAEAMYLGNRLRPILSWMKSPPSIELNGPSGRA